MNKRIKLMLLAILVLTLCIATVGLSACKDTTDKSKLTVTYDDSHTVYEGDTLDSLKPYLTVKYTDKVGNVSTVTDYALSGTLNKGEATVTVKYQGLTATCKVTVTEKGQQAKPTIKVELNGGKLNGEFTVNDDGTLTPPAEPTREGYTFSGWYKDEECTVPWNFERDKVTVEITLYIKWHKIDTSKPTVNANVGDGATSNGNFVVNDDNTLTPPQDPVRGGYAFVGWYKDNGCVNVWNFATDKVTENITLYAKWQPKQYTITLDYNGATGGNAQQTLTVTYDQSVGALPAPTKTGYEFVGWKHGENAVTSSTVWKTDNNTTFVAQWNKQEVTTYTVTFKADGKTIGTQKYTAENKNITEPAVPNKTGYNGVWEKYTLIMGDITVNAVYTPITYNVTFKDDNAVVGTQTYNIENKNITAPTVPNKTGYTGQWEQYTLTTGDITVNAVYTAKQYTVTLNYDGATSGNTQTTLTVTYDQPIGTLPTPEKTGYTFIGWKHGENAVTSSTVWKTDNNATFTAQWNKILTPTEGLAYALNSDGESYSVTGIGTATDTDIVIPSTYNDKPVTSIGYYAFSDCISLISITIGDSVTSIDLGAFSGCSSLTSIIIPDSVTSIVSGAFYNCSSLKYNEYDNAYYLGNDTNKYVVLIKANNTSRTSCTINENTKVVFSNAFGGCNNLARINYLGTIESWCNIQGLANLMRYGTSSKTLSLNGEPVTELVIPSSVTSIPSWAFAKTNITSVTFEENSQCTSIVSGAFDYCNNLANINYLGTIESWCNIQGLGNLHGLGNGTSSRKLVIDGKEITGDLAIPSTVTSIPSYAFAYTNITGIIIHDNVTSIGSSAFSGCSKLTSIIIPNSVTSIGNAAFSCCHSSFIIYCESASKPDGWDDDWNDYDYPIIWNCKTNDKDKDGYAYAVIDGLRYSLKDNVATVIVQPSNITEANIPQKVTYKGADYSVTSIGYGAFSGCSSLISITIPFVGASKDGTGNIHFGHIFGASSYSNNSSYVPSSLKTVVITGGNTIAANAFYKCSNITSITIPNSVTSIGSLAFYGCSSLGSIIIPNSVTGIGKGAFENCSSLESITIPFVGASKDGTENTHFGYIFGASSGKGKYNSNTCRYTNGNADYVPLSLKTVVITGGNTIAADAFYQCFHITSTTIPNSVTSIGSLAFYNCDKLASIKYLGTIESWCNIQGLDNLMSYGTSNRKLVIDGKEITGDLAIPSTITSIPSYAFARTNITSVTIPNSVTSIGASAFNGCSSLQSATIPNSVTSIGASAFNGCSSLQSITIGNSVSNICGGYNYIYGGHDDAFYGCDNLASINYLGTIESWCNIQGLNYLMQYGTNSKTFSLNGEPVTELVIPSSVTSIPSWAFAKTNITSVTFEENSQCTSIVSGAFSGCSSLTSITIPDSVTSIGQYAFSGCSKLESITIPFVGASKDGTSNTHFGYIFGAEYAYNSNSSYTQNSNCVPSSLKTVVITGGNTIAADAFYKCSNITSITIPNSVTSIGGNLNSGSSAFDGCSNLASINYRGTIESWCNIRGLDYLMTYGTSSKTLVIDSKEITGDLVIPSTVTSIPYYAFYRTNITSVTFEENSQCTSIISCAFSGCRSLQSATIPNSVTSIDSSAFDGCSSLESITIPDSVTSIGSSAFYRCSSLKTVYYVGTAADWNKISIYDYNINLTSAARYYYSESEPALNADGTAYDGNYWHYVDGVATVWKKEA